MAPTVRELAARLPDLPRLVETRAMLLSGACEVIGDTAQRHYVVRSLDAGVAAVVGRPSATALRETVARGGTIDVLCAEEAAADARAALPGWVARPAIVHLLAAAAAEPEEP